MCILSDTDKKILRCCKYQCANRIDAFIITIRLKHDYFQKNVKLKKNDNKIYLIKNS